MAPTASAPCKSTLPPYTKTRTLGRDRLVTCHVDGELDDPLLLAQTDHVHDPTVERGLVGAHDEARLTWRRTRLLEAPDELLVPGDRIAIEKDVIVLRERDGER